ncbi:low temperature requirement A protein (LtrA) [Arthrobacter sp. ov407]|nr:low temperature requirement A protein (LtrA) [Arthrobacter sp. ov407]
MAQVGWVALIFASLPIGTTSWIIVALTGVELAGPLLAERKDGGTPWHPHHIAERYSLLVIITLGEVILGTVLAISAVVDRSGWSVEAVLVAFGGTALAFAMWWLYFARPRSSLHPPWSRWAWVRAWAPHPSSSPSRQPSSTSHTRQSATDTRSRL